VATSGASTQVACSNKPTNAISVTYSASSGLTANNCPVASVPLRIYWGWGTCQCQLAVSMN
jgi:hypothetical protein